MLNVVLGRSTSVYHPGEVLAGEAVLNIPFGCKILALTVNYVGYSSVSFLVPKGRGKKQTCEKVEEIDTHLDVLLPLVKSFRGVEIEEGVHIYPFRLVLPSLLPSSYNSPYGNISYFVHVHLLTSTAAYNIRKAYFVRAPVNINLFELHQNPQTAEITKTYGMWSKKTMYLRATVQNTCFVPGDMIPVFVELYNETDRQLNYLFCTLKQVTTVQVHLKDQTVDRVTKQCLLTVAHKLYHRRGHYSWVCQLPSPTFLVPTIATSTVVFVTYFIQVSIEVDREAVPPDLQIPIVFGTRAPVVEAVANVNPTAETESDCTTNKTNQISPTVTNPRRRVTVCSQPKIRFANLPRRASQQPRRLGVDSDNESFKVGSGGTDAESTVTELKRRVTVSSQPRFGLAIIRQESYEDQTNVCNLILDDSDERLLSDVSNNPTVNRKTRRCFSVGCRPEGSFSEQITDANTQQFNEHKDLNGKKKLLTGSQNPSGLPAKSSFYYIKSYLSAKSNLRFIKKRNKSHDVENLVQNASNHDSSSSSSSSVTSYFTCKDSFLGESFDGKGSLGTKSLFRSVKMEGNEFEDQLSFSSPVVPLRRNSADSVFSTISSTSNDAMSTVSLSKNSSIRRRVTVCTNPYSRLVGEKVEEDKSQNNTSLGVTNSQIQSDDCSNVNNLSCFNYQTFSKRNIANQVNDSAHKILVHSARRVGVQLHSVASNLTQQLNSQLQLQNKHSRRNSCDQL